MNRKLLLLNGLAILAVVSNHASGWGVTAMFWWTHRYLPVDVPNFDQLNSLSYWLLVLLKQLTVFSVPAFLFVSGAFMAYAGRGGSGTLNWKTLLARVRGLLIPYLIWSVVYFTWSGIKDGPLPVLEYPWRLLAGKAVGGFFYVPVLVQMLILSKWLVGWANKRPLLVLGVSAALQLGMLALRYLPVNGFNTSGVLDWLFVNWIFFFVVGVVVAQHQPQVAQRLKPYRWVFLALLLAMAVAAVVEPEWRSRLTGNDGWKGTAQTISTSLYAVCFILAYLAFEDVDLPFSKTFYQLGGKSFGIYLSHILVLEIVARLIYHFIPFLLAHQILLQPVLIALGVGVPYILIKLLMKSPVRSISRYLIG